MVRLNLINWGEGVGNRWGGSGSVHSPVLVFVFVVGVTGVTGYWLGEGVGSRWCGSGSVHSEALSLCGDGDGVERVHR